MSFLRSISFQFANDLFSLSLVSFYLSSDSIDVNFKEKDLALTI